MPETEIEFTRRRLAECRAILANAKDQATKDYYTAIVAQWESVLRKLEANA